MEVANTRPGQPLLRRVTTNVRKWLNITDDTLSADGIDRVSRFLFPALFAFFNFLYWIVYTQPIVFS